MKNLSLILLLVLVSCCSPQKQQPSPWDMTGRELYSEEFALKQKIESGNGTYNDVDRLREVRYQIKLQKDAARLPAD